MIAMNESAHMTQRHLRALGRQPAYIAITLAQPIIWLVLFGSLFKSVVDLPGFGAESYLVFLTPAIVVMTSLFSSGWSGMGVIEDLDRGVLDRFLVSPVRRSSLLNGRLAEQAITCIIQSMIIIAIGLAMGARFPSFFVGSLVVIVAAMLLGAAFASFSHALALTLRTRESVIGASQFVMLPAVFLSTAFMAEALMPGWIATIARYNPVNWAIVAGRSALSPDPDWLLIGTRLAALAALAVLMALIATRAFQSYRRSI
jgi:ABC-2 type transport system permease protein